MFDNEFQFGVKQQIYNGTMREQRLLLGMTQAQLADRVGCSMVFINHIEGLRHFPNELRRKQISKALNLDDKVLFPPWLKEFSSNRTKSRTYLVSTPDAVKLAGNPNLITETIESVEHDIDNSLLSDKIDLILSALSNRERRIIELRFGLDGRRARTSEEVGKEFNVTRARIQQIEEKALKTLRKQDLVKQLLPFFNS